MEAAQSSQQGLDFVILYEQNGMISAKVEVSVEALPLCRAVKDEKHSHVPLTSASASNIVKLGWLVQTR